MGYTKPVFRYIEEQEKANFSQSQCLLTISVGQEVHEGEKFFSTIELVNGAFNSCIMLIDDSLQRHTMAINTTKDAAFFYKTSVKEGNLWLKRNEKYYSRLTILKKIIRWDTWLAHPAYESKQKELKTLIENDVSYRETFEDTITEFLRRYYERLQRVLGFDMAKARQLCFDYLLEECVAMCLWHELNCHFEVYPSRRNQAMSETHRRFVLPNYPDLLHPVGIKFKNRKQLKPQCFEVLKDKKEKILTEIMME